MLRVLSYPLLLLLLLLAGYELCNVVRVAAGTPMGYKWLLIGIASYFVLRLFSFFTRNERWMQTFSHELSHAVVGIMFFRKIHSFQVNEQEGVVFHSGRDIGQIFISLAPYCLPLFTYVFILMRVFTVADMIYVMDILIGFTMAFHILCFARQTHPLQPDIQSQGVVRSVLFIVAVWCFNLSIILLTVSRGLWGAITYIFPRYWNDIEGVWNMIF